MTSVYARREAQWRLLLHLQTPVPEQVDPGTNGVVDCGDDDASTTLGSEDRRSRRSH